MKKTFTIVVPDYNDYLDSFSHRSFALLPVGDQPLAAHWLDHTLDLGMQKVRFILKQPDDIFEQWIKDASIWPMELSTDDGAELITNANIYMNRPPFHNNGLIAGNSGNFWGLMKNRKQWEMAWIERIHPKDRIGEGVKIGKNVFISNSAKVGDHVTIGDNVVIGDQCYIGDHAVLATDSSIWNSRLDSNTYLGRGTRLNNHWLTSSDLINIPKQLIHRSLDPLIAGIAG